MADDHDRIHQQFFGAAVPSPRPPVAPSRGSRYGHGCLVSTTLLGFIPAVSLCVHLEWTVMGLCLVTLYAIGVYSDHAGWLAKVVYTIPVLLMLGLLGAGGLFNEAVDLWEDWQQHQQRSETRGRMFTFYREHYPQAMAIRSELDSQIGELEEKRSTLRRIDAVDEEQRRLLTDSRTRLSERLDSLTAARTDLDTGLMRMYLAYLEHGDPYGGTISQDVDESVARVRDVLAGIESLSGEAVDQNEPP